MRYFFSFLLSIVMFAHLGAQVSPVLSLVSKTNDSACYEILLLNNGKKSVSLAGQNYRLYYDAANATLVEGSITSYLPVGYTSLKLVQHVHNADASGFGVLPYEAHLGFINLATDYKLTSNDIIAIAANEKVKIASFCIETTNGQAPEMTWAQENLTHTYATAFVEVALKNEKSLYKAELGNHLLLRDKNISTQKPDVFDLSYFPNPFTEKLHIEFNSALDGNANLNVYDVFGKLLVSKTVISGSTSATIEDNRIPMGAVIVEITTSNGVVNNFKAIKIK